jgi:hypothetical protein
MDSRFKWVAVGIGIAIFLAVGGARAEEGKRNGGRPAGGRRATK